jgi:hypothetical protein
MSLAMHHPEISTIHEQYLAISRIAREQFAGAAGGKILLCAGPCCVAAVVAASIAGAASLWIDADAEALRAALRAGFCDFVVSTLDEALRILKNEVRQKRPVSVGLCADPQLAVREMVERGFQPDLLIALAVGSERELRILIQRGAVVVPEQSEQERDSSLLCWSVDAEAAQSLPRIARIAAEALDPERPDTAARRRWLLAAPRYLGRSFARQGCVCMDRNESAAFVTQVRADNPAVSLACNGEGI